MLFFPFKTIIPREKCLDICESSLRKKVWLKLCGFEARAATDIVLNRSTKKRNKAEIIETLHSKEWSSCLPSHVVKPLKSEIMDCLLYIYLSASKCLHFQDYFNLIIQTTALNPFPSQYNWQEDDDLSLLPDYRMKYQCLI